MPTLTSFKPADFNIFHIDGLENRMVALRKEIRPKFEELGHYVEPLLTSIIGEPVTTHIAKHARRTVNPPDETWVAWSTNRRGYKAHPHFQIGLNKDYLFICFALIYECTEKPFFAHNMRKNLDKIWPSLPSHFTISEDHTRPEFTLKENITEEKLQIILTKLEKIKKMEFLCGVHIPKDDQSDLHQSNLLKHITETFHILYPLYLLAKEGDPIGFNNNS